MDWTILWWVLALLIVISGLIGTVVPALPGVPMIFAGLLLTAWVTDFEQIGWVTIGILGALTVFAVMIDFLSAAFGAKKQGASPRAFWGATLGAIVGLFFGLVGIVLGPFIGAVAAEMSAGSGARQAGRSGYGVWIGLVLGTAAKLAIAFLMLGIFLTKYIFS
ncbi:MAG: DUF456 domain-containing protein [Xanthomonadales bacterium]|jgi:uncharacterized protein YqgC (DUF456 family)|nr:DUF456 domain-containing protein [Xanthomonadales bacterium]